jgi:hypothetical protein
MGKPKDFSYFLWLCAKLRCKNNMEFRALLRALSSKDFFSLIELDDNRALDGLRYRHYYKEATELEPPSGNCSVLEVLVGLAERMSYILYDPDIDNEDQIHVWFWELIRNLGLDPFDSHDDSMDKIDRWLNRNFYYDGDGSPFPLQNPIEDQREIEIWYQMQAYLNEKLYIV